MKRRDFLKTFGAFAGAAVLDPERLLWVPGRKTYFLPPTEIVQASTIDEALALGFSVRLPNGDIVAFGRDDPLVLEPAVATRYVEWVKRIGGTFLPRDQAKDYWRETRIV